MTRLPVPLVLTLLLSGCVSVRDGGTPLESRARFLMGTVCTISLPADPRADASANAAFDEIARIEALVSTWRPDSELSRINRAPAGSAIGVSGEVAALLERAVRIATETGGAFTPLAGRLVELWDLRGEGRVPSSDAARAAAAAIARGGVRIDRGRLTVSRIGEVTLDEGGFAKGYALDRAIDTLRARGVARAILDFGGQVALYGFAAPVEIDIAHPQDRQRPAVRIAIRTGSVSTSSGSEKWFADGSARYSHIVDPRTGMALPPSGSASAIHDEALEADALSTALYVLGPTEGLAFADRAGVAAIWLVPEEGGAWRVVRSTAASALPLEIHPDFNITEKELR